MRIALALLALFSLFAAPPSEAFHDCVFRGARGPISYYSCSAQPASEQPPKPPTMPRSLVEGTPVPLAELLRTIAKRNQVDPRLIGAVISVESEWNPRAVSPKGAMGLMQLMPETARRYSVRDPFDPHQNIDGGVRYLRDLLVEFRDLELALAAYNAGEEAVRLHRGIPPYPETREYVRRVLALYHG